MVKSLNGLMKRTFVDGQFTVRRHTDWLLQVTIEGPLGQRAGTHFSMWVDMLPKLHAQRQYILLMVPNIGPVYAPAFGKLPHYVEQGDIGGIAIVGSEFAKKNLAQIVDETQHLNRIAYVDDEDSGHQFLQDLTAPGM